MSILRLGIYVQGNAAFGQFQAFAAGDPGDFSASVLTAIQLDADAIWEDSAERRSYTAEVESVRAVIENSTATLTQLESPDNDLVVGVNWIDASTIGVSDIVSNCDLTGPEITTRTQPYALDIFKKVDFSVDLFKFRNNFFEATEVTAKALMAAMKSMDEFLAQTVLVKLKAFAGVNSAAGAAALGGTYAAGTTTIPGAAYNSTMVPGLVQAMILNRMRDSYTISNGELFKEFFLAERGAVNTDGTRRNDLFAALGNVYFDLFNFVAAGLTEDAFIVGDGSVAFANKSLFPGNGPNNPIYIQGQVNQWRYSMPSYNIPGVRYDVYHTIKCVSVGNQDHIVHVYRLQVAAGFFLNPASAFQTGNVGVLSLTKGA